MPHREKVSAAVLGIRELYLARKIDGFWGTLKRKMYYNRKFTSRDHLIHVNSD